MEAVMPTESYIRTGVGASDKPTLPYPVVSSPPLSASGLVPGRRRRGPLALSGVSRTLTLLLIGNAFDIWCSVV